MMSSRSDSEGEIHEHEVDKATTAQPSSRGISVDRQSRPRASDPRSPRDAYEDAPRRNRSRSPYRHRSPRGEKRRRDEDFYSDRDRRDPRHFKVRYEERRTYDDERRHRVSYADLDRGSSSRPSSRYDDPRDRDRNRYSRHSTRSRSPPHRGGLDRAYDRRNGRHEPERRDRRQQGRETGAEWRSREHSGTERVNGGHESRTTARQDGPSRAKQRDAQKDTAVRYSDAEASRGAEGPNGTTRDAEMADANDQDQPELEPEPVNYDDEVERRRKRREAIKAKFMDQPTPLRVQVLQPGIESGPSTPQAESPGGRTERSVSPMVTSPSTPQDSSAPASPPIVAVQNDEELANRKRVDTADAEGPSAADYDPIMDTQEDRAIDGRRQSHDVSATAYNEVEVQPEPREAPIAESKVEESPVKKTKDDFDMFAEDDDDDMFAATPVKVSEATENAKAPQVKKLDSSMLDVWDDPQGYYKVILNELLDDRYEVQSRLGKGVFSEVVRAKDIRTGDIVAIKIIRNDEILRKAGVKEIEMLEKLIDNDPEDKRHCIRLERSFDHKHHLCMVFEHLSINLREVLKKFGRDVGLHLKAVRSYAQQMFVSLSLLRKCNIVHADIKPDNMLVNENRTILKICDLGSAADISECEVPAGLLVSRFYRAPEIMLGIPHDYGIDMWAVGCTLFELYTGKILFTGRDNNQMLRSIQECRGKLSPKLLKKGWAEYVFDHFDANLQMFRSVETDKITGKDVTRMLNFVKPTRDLKSRLISSTKGLSEAEIKEINLFYDLLDKCLALNPEKRITPTEALKHPFIHRTKV
ncbi:serine threonine-protein kinase prp4 [Diplodia corticola]|uniref:non-specific serine/threonine protein kinase n=1 Tax=Diplodia corticola TaxID=236234 RepID=A0A1J9SJ37_9PEZI|nr:serine threonine-protein kinase prp4 [Diplodia corticola]OJD39764.1 serine threonine-protein kinase prp4 [Diplodia corticola]